MSDEKVIENKPSETKLAEAMDIVKRNMLWSAGAGVLPFPWIDFVAITAVEMKLIKELTEHYGLVFRKDLAKSSITSLVASLGSVTLGKVIAISTLRLIPIIGPIVAVTSLPAIAAGVTYAIGKVFILHFEAGGTLLDFDPAKVREHFRAEFANGRSAAARATTGMEGEPVSA